MSTAPSATPAQNPTFCLPDIGEGVHEGEIVQWLVKEGDQVSEDQPLIEVMTDKVTAEIPSPRAGVIQQCHGQPGDRVQVGAVLVTYADDAVTGETPSASPSPPPASSITSDAAVETPSSSPTPSITGSSPSASVKPVASTLRAAPATRQLARQLGVNLNSLSGTGDGGRITAEDVRHAADQQTQESSLTATLSQTTPSGSAATENQPSLQTEQSPSLAPSPSASATQADDSHTNAKPTSQASEGQTQEKPFAGIRRRIAEHLTHAWQTIPHFGYVDEVDMTAIIRLREQLLPTATADGLRLHYMPFVMKAVIQALRTYPQLNSRLHDDGSRISTPSDIHLGFAVDTEDGLIVPVIHQAQQLTLRQLTEQIQQLATRARAGQLSRDEVTGGTFTLTNIGSIGGLFGLPIINSPEVAILGLHKIQRRPVVDPVTDALVARDMMYLSLSCDHRVVDGADAARFMNKIIETLQHPGLLLYD